MIIYIYHNANYNFAFWNVRCEYYFFFATTDRRLTYAAELSQKFFFPKSHEFFLFHFTGLGTIVNIWENIRTNVL